MFLRSVHPMRTAPEVIELEVPKGLIVLNSGVAGKGAGLMGFENVTDVSAVPGGGGVAPGYVRVRLDKSAKASWGIYNFLKLQFQVVDSALAGRTASDQEIL